MDKIEDPKIIEKIRKILEDSNKNDPYLIAKQIYREVVAEEIEKTKSDWEAFGYAHKFGRHGH